MYTDTAMKTLIGIAVGALLLAAASAFMENVGNQTDMFMWIISRYM